MPLPLSNLADIAVISVHDEEEPLHFSIPSVVPSRYDIPGINADKEVFKSCMFSFPDQKPIQYAFRRTLQSKPYVLIRIVEPKTFIYGTEQMKMDEYGQKLSPDVQRVPVPVRMEQVANEIERQCGHMGLKAIQGDVTGMVIDEITQKNIDFMRKTVADTNRLYKRSPMNVTSQARRRAARLHKMGFLNPLPEWAEINPEAAFGQGLDMMNCVNCQRLIRRSVVKCECGAIYNWLEAVNMGMIKPADVPPSRRKEAGLFAEDLPRTVSGSTSPDLSDPVKDPDDNDAIESLA